MDELQPIIVFHSRHVVRHLEICKHICVNLLQLMSGVITHSSVNKRSLYINKWLSQPITVFHARHLVRHLGICNHSCAKLLQLMFGIITYNSVKKGSFYINKWLNYSQLQCITAGIFSAILEFVIRFVSNYQNRCLVSLRTIRRKNEVSILISGRVTANYSVSRPPFCPPSWNQ